MSTSASNPPIDRIQLGSIQAAIWRNAEEESPERGSYSVTFQRSYRDRDGKWQSTIACRRDDLLVMAELAKLAFLRINQLQAEERSRSSSNGTHQDNGSSTTNGRSGSSEKGERSTRGSRGSR